MLEECAGVQAETRLAMQGAKRFFPTATTLNRHRKQKATTLPTLPD